MTKQISLKGLEKSMFRQSIQDGIIDIEIGAVQVYINSKRLPGEKTTEQNPVDSPGQKSFSGI